MAIVYVWGKVEESQQETVSGATYARIDLKLYRSNSPTVPPAATEVNLYSTSITGVVMDYRQEGAYPGPPNTFSVNVTNNNQTQLIPPNTSTFNPVYPKQRLTLPDGTFFYIAFNGYSRNAMKLLKEETITDNTMATLEIDFTVPTPTPVNGFIVKYRALGSTVYTTVFPNPTSSPVIVTVPSGVGYEGSIKSDCGNSSSSPEYTFIAYGSTSLYLGVGATAQLACSGGTPPLSYISNAYSDIAPGISVYTNQALTTLLTGPSFIINSFGIIYNISNGVVGTSTGTSCGV